MTKYTNRASLLASGAREVTIEELDWVSGGAGLTALGDRQYIMYRIDPASAGGVTDDGKGMITVIANGLSDFARDLLQTFGISGGHASGSASGDGAGGGTTVAQTDPNGDIDGDGIPNNQDPVDDTIVVTGKLPPLVDLGAGFEIRFFGDGIGVLFKDGAQIGNVVPVPVSSAQVVITTANPDVNFTVGARGATVGGGVNPNSQAVQGFNYTNQP